MICILYAVFSVKSYKFCNGTAYNERIRYLYEDFTEIRNLIPEKRQFRYKRFQYNES